MVDASVVVAALIDTGPVGAWAEDQLAAGPLAAPHLMPGAVANILRRAALAGEISVDTASLAHQDLLSLPLGLFAYSTCAQRVWELRANVIDYDAWYAALAETLDAALATLDVTPNRAAGPECTFVLPRT